MSKHTPRGIRLNNPGNIRRTTDKWQGLAAEQVDDEFFTFKSPVWGIRAMARILLRYQDHYELETIDEIIRRWTPPVGYANGKSYTQDTDAAIRNIASFSGLGRFDVLDLHRYDHLAPLVKAIIRQENGQQPYPQSVIDRGLELAGVVPETRKATRSPEGQAGAVAAGTAGATSLAEIINHASPALPIISTLAENAPWVLAAGLALAVGWFVYQRRALN